MTFHSASSTRAAAPEAAATERQMRGVATANGSAAKRRRNLSPFNDGPMVTTTGATTGAGAAGEAAGVRKMRRCSAKTELRRLLSLLHTTRSGECASLSTRLQPCLGGCTRHPPTSSTLHYVPRMKSPLFRPSHALGQAAPSHRHPWVWPSCAHGFPPPSRPSEQPLVAQEGKSGLGARSELLVP